MAKSKAYLLRPKAQTDVSAASTYNGRRSTILRAKATRSGADQHQLPVIQCLVRYALHCQSLSPRSTIHGSRPSIVKVSRRSSVPGWGDTDARFCKFSPSLTRTCPHGLVPEDKTDLSKIALSTRPPAYPLSAAVLMSGWKTRRGTKGLLAFQLATIDAKA